MSLDLKLSTTSLSDDSKSSSTLEPESDECIDIKLFASKYSVINYKCKICQNICQNAMQLNCKEHSNDSQIYLYGKYCLENYLLKHGQLCPINNHLNVSYIPNSFARKSILSSKVKCLYYNKTPKCNWKGLYQNLQIHLHTECKSVVKTQSCNFAISDIYKCKQNIVINDPNEQDENIDPMELHMMDDCHIHTEILKDYMVDNKLLSRIYILEEDNKKKDVIIDNLMDEVQNLKSQMNMVLQFIQEVQEVDEEQSISRTSNSGKRINSASVSGKISQINSSDELTDYNNSGSNSRSSSENEEENLNYIGIFDEIFRGKHILLSKNQLTCKLDNNSEMYEQTVRFKEPLIEGIHNLIQFKLSFQDHGQPFNPEFYVGVASDFQSKHDYNGLIDSWKSFTGIYCNSRIFKGMEWKNYLYKNFEFKSGDTIKLLADFTKKFGKKLYIFQNDQCLNEKDPIVLPNDLKLHKQWFPVISMCSIGTHSFTIIN